MKKNLGSLEQLFVFTGTILASTVAILINSPLLFTLCFLGGIGYHVVRGKSKGWKLPNGVKNLHSW